MTRPVIFLAFANDLCDERYLRNLPEEQRRLRELFEDSMHWELILRPNATPEEIFEVFQNPVNRGRIAIFHFGGHADGSTLQFEVRDGSVANLYSDGFAEFLGQQDLKLVFLNGCATRSFGEAVFKANVPAVIFTAMAIDDLVATEFSNLVHGGIVGGLTVAAAFNEASAACRARIGDDFKLSLRRDAATKKPVFATESKVLEREKAWPWKLLADTGGGDWSLARAVEDPLFGVPPAAHVAPPPGSPFRVLARFIAEDSPIYFGRSREIRDIYQKCVVPAPGIILFHGASGAGKSSLLEAGLEPRIKATHTVFCLRRTRSAGLAGDLCAKLTTLAGADLSIAEAWRKTERDTGRPILAILDQAEEAFTRPQADVEAEWRALFDALVPLFGPSAQLPRGKLILSFRKEWLPEIEKRVRILTCAYSSLFLPPLDREGVIEGVEGVTRTPELQQHYKISIAPGLADDIATELLKDCESPVAPTLEVLLQDMWDAAGHVLVPPDEERQFTRKLYDDLVKRGLTVRAFLSRQLAQIGTDADLKARALDTGLALDLLAYHTTSLGTAERRTREDITQHYAHLPSELVNDLLSRLEELSLLFGVGASSGHRAAGRITRLAHDSLAPLVQEALDKSDLSGQRAQRILATRVASVADEASLATAPLDEFDLKIVEAGTHGMRALTQEEVVLMTVSKAARAQRIRNDEARVQAEKDFADERVRAAQNQAEEERRRVKTNKQYMAVFTVLLLVLIFVLTGAWLVTKSKNDDLKVSTKAAEKATTEAVQLQLTAEKLTLKAVHQRSLDQYSTALREFGEGHHGEGIAYLCRSLDIWPENRLAADCLFGALTQKWLALPLFEVPNVRLPSSMFDIAWVPGVGLRFFHQSRDADGASQVWQLSEHSGTGKKAFSKIEFLSSSGHHLSLGPMATWSADGRYVADVYPKGEGFQAVVLEVDTGRVIKELSIKVIEVTFLTLMSESHGLILGGLLAKHSEPELMLWNYVSNKKSDWMSIAKSVAEASQMPSEFESKAPKLDQVHAKGNSDELSLHLSYGLNNETRFYGIARAKVNWSTLKLKYGEANLDRNPGTAGTEDRTFTQGLDCFIVTDSDRNGDIYELKTGEVVQIGLEEYRPGRSRKYDDLIPPLQCWPGTGRFIKWGRSSCSLSDTWMDFHDQPEPSNLVWPGVSWPGSDTAFVASSGHLVAITHREVRRIDRSPEDQLKIDVCVYDARSSLLWPSYLTSDVSNATYDAPLQKVDTIYRVKAGETLGAIADRFSSTVPDLVNANHIAKPDVIRLGQQLVLPRKGIVIAKSGQGDELLGAAAKQGEQVWQRQGLPVLKHKDGTYIELDAPFARAWGNSMAGCFSPDGKIVVAVASTMTEDDAKSGAEIVAWSADTGKQLTSVTSLKYSISILDSATLDEPVVVAFTQHPDVLCIVGNHGEVLLWDWKRSKPFSGLLMPLMSYYRECSGVTLNQGDGWVEVAANIGTKRITRRYETGFAGYPEKFTGDFFALATAIGGRRLDANDVMTDLSKNTPEMLSELRLLRKVFESPDADLKDPCVRLGRWLLADRATRTVSPNATQTIAQTFDMLLELGALDSAEMLTFADPEKMRKLKTKRETVDKEMEKAALETR